MSRGQIPRTPEYFPRMNDRAGRRRVRASLARAQRFCDEMNQRFEAGVTTEAQYGEQMGIERPFNRGGFIQPSEPAQFTLAVDECVVNKRDGQWRCYRTDPVHVATKRHTTFPAMLQLHDNHPELFADLGRPTE